MTTSAFEMPFQTAPDELPFARMATTVEGHASQLATMLYRRVPGLIKLDEYYRGDQPLSYMAEELEKIVAPRIRQLVINWPELVVDSLAERIEIGNFRRPDQTDAMDDVLEQVWRYNDLAETQSELYADALALGRAYVIVGNGEDGVPSVTMESPLQVFAERDPRTRQVRRAIKLWRDQSTTFAAIYLPDSTHFLTFGSDEGMWKVDQKPILHNWGIPAVVPFTTRPRTLIPDGRSEMESIIPLADAANKIATDMMVTAEFHAMPRRIAYGFREEDFEDEAGNPVSRWAREAGALWTAPSKNGPEGAEIQQLPEATLSNFHDTLTTLARMVISMSGLTPAHLGISGEHMASAEAVRAIESRLVRRAELRRQPWSGSWKTVMRLSHRVMTGAWDDDLRKLEVGWVDASTPTVAQRADAAVKLFANGTGPVTKRQTREDLSYTASQIARMEQDDEQAARLSGLAFGLTAVHDATQPQPADAATTPLPGDLAASPPVA